MEKKTGKEALYLAFVLLALAAGAFCIVMASTLNPWSVQLTHLDSAVWISRAIEMKQGAVLYRDVWDHKGPVLFFIECLGLTLTPHSLTGIWILEWAAILITLWFFYKTARLYVKNKAAAVSAALISIVPLARFYQQGNCVEEWALPFMGASVYIFVRFFQTKVLKLWQVGVTGFCAMACFFLNGNLISVWAAFVPLTALYLMIKKRWKDLGLCAAAFLLGALAVFVPVFLYLTAGGAFGDFLNAYFGFNEGYIAGVGIRDYYYSIMEFIYKDNWFLYVHLAFLVLLLHQLFHKKVSWEWLWFVYVGVSLVLLSMSGRRYIHYGIQLVPCMIIPAAFLVRKVFGWCKNTWEYAAIWAVLFVAVFRFDAADYVEKDIRWLFDKEVINTYACGELSDYQVINDWTGQYSQEELEERVWEYHD